MNVLLIESHPLLRIALFKMLKGISGIGQVISADAADIDGLALPDGGVDLIVFGMPADLDVGWHLLSKVRTTWAASRVLLLSDIVPLEVPLGGLSDGVVGCLSKFAALADLEAAFHLVARGHQVGVGGYRQVPPALPAGVPGSNIAASISTPALLHDGFDYEEAQILGLTPRQYEVLVLLARGHPLKVISREMNISVPTVKSHAQALYKQLKVGGKGAAVFAARQQGARLGWDCSSIASIPRSKPPL
jgi:DNA-binding NarL/FixJ family response regulator